LFLWRSESWISAPPPPSLSATSSIQRAPQAPQRVSDRCWFCTSASQCNMHLGSITVGCGAAGLCRGGCVCFWRAVGRRAKSRTRSGTRDIADLDRRTVEQADPDRRTVEQADSDRRTVEHEDSERRIVEQEENQSCRTVWPFGGLPWRDWQDS